MTALALVLVLSSAVPHATWNLPPKRVRAEMPFLFLIYIVGPVAYTPFAISVLFIAKPKLGLGARIRDDGAIHLPTDAQQMWIHFCRGDGGLDAATRRAHSKLARRGSGENLTTASKVHSRQLASAGRRSEGDPRLAITDGLDA